MDSDTEPPISAAFLALLRCPLTRQLLAFAPPGMIAKLEAARLRHELRDSSGTPIATAFTRGLLRSDGTLLFPIRDGIPILTADHAIVVTAFTDQNAAA